MDDQTAIAAIKQGDLNGLESLMLKYQARAVQAAYLIVYDRGLAEEVVQTAFVKAIEHIHQFEEGRSFAPWFFRIVVNDAVKLAKKQKRYLSLDEFDEPTIKLAHWLVDSSTGPEQLLEEKEMRERILDAIRCLPLEQRCVVVLRYFLDMSEAELSTRMERPLSTIKWWLRSARKRLYDRMGNSK